MRPFKEKYPIFLKGCQATLNLLECAKKEYKCLISCDNLKFQDYKPYLNSIEQALSLGESIFNSISLLKFNSASFSTDIQYLKLISDNAYRLQSHVNMLWSSQSKELCFSNNASAFRKLRCLSASIFQELDYYTTHFIYKCLDFDEE